MGGKTKQANRTKNNVRPSSSGRSAELISTLVNPSLVLVGPGTLLPAVFPSLAGPTLDYPLSNEFLLCFKKFHKKDPITKIKALNELKDIVAKKDQDEVANALASWAHYYPSLTVDMDRKVREATQACHGTIVRKCGRKVALQIKRLLPAWLIAQHDDYAPAQYIAQTDLNSTFPNDKLAEAIKFCKLEICNLYLDNLKGNAEYMLSGKKIDDIEEREAQLARVMASTLRAMELLITNLPTSQGDWLWDALLPLICANSYWQLAGHSSHNVRASWYILTGGLVERFAARLPADLGRRLARALVAHPEKVAGVCAERWLSLLKMMHNMPNWLTLMDKKDLLVKRLLDVLENAAWGEARKLSDLLLPLLAHLPAEMLTKDFYCTFFMAMFTGLHQKMLLNMKSEREHWNNIIAQCIRYVSTRHQWDEFVVSLISWTHRTWLDKVLTVPESQAKPYLVKCTATHMAELVTHWLHQAKDGDLIFDQMVRNFWLNIGSTMSTQVEKLSAELDDTVSLCETHTLFIMTMKTTFVHGARKKRTIKFEDEPTEVTDAAPAQMEIDEATNKRFQHNLEDAVEMLIGFYFEFMNQHRAMQKVMPVLVPLLKEFQSLNLFRMLAQKFEAEPIFNLYDRVLRVWLGDEKLCSKAIVEMVFLLVQYISDEEKDALFDSFKKQSAEVVEWSIAVCLARPHRGTAAMTKWMHSQVVDEVLVALVRREDDDDAKSLLLAALAQDDDGVMVSDKAIADVVSTSSELLNSLIAHDPEVSLPEDIAHAARHAAGGKLAGKSAGGVRGDARPKRKDAPDPLVRLEPRVRFSAHILQALSPHRSSLALPLLLSLFRLNLRVPRGSVLLGARAWDETLSAWRDALLLLEGAHRTQFVRDALHYIHWHLFYDVDTLNIQRIDHIVSLCPCLVFCGDEQSDRAELVEHSKLVLDIEVRSRPSLVPLEVFALQLDVIWGNLNCPFEGDNDWIAAVVKDEPALTKETLMTHVYKLLFRALYAQTIFLLTPRSGDELIPEIPALGIALLEVDYFRELVCNIVHDCAVLNVLCEHYNFWIHYDIIRDTKQRIDKVLQDIVRNTPPSVHHQLAAALDELADAHGYYWVYAKGYYHDTVLFVEQHQSQLQEPADDLDDEDNKEVSMAESDFNDTLDTFDSLDSSEAEYTDVKDDDSDHTDSEESNPTSSFEIVDAIDDTACASPCNEQDVFCDCQQVHMNNPLVVDDLLAKASKSRKASYLGKAAKPTPKLVSRSAEVVSYVELLGEMVMMNGFYHEAQLKASEVKKQKLKAKAMFDKLQDDKLTRFKINGQYKIFDKWTDDQEAYRQVAVDVHESLLYTAKEYAMMRTYYCLYADEAPQVDEFVSDVTSNHCNLDAVLNGYYRHNETMLFERELSNASWLQLSSTAAVADLLCEAVTSRGWDASAAHWDFTNIALCSMLTSLALSAPMYSGATSRLALVARPTLELYVRVRRFVGGVRAQCMRCQPSVHVAALPREWADIFAPDVTKSLCLLICHVLDKSSRTVTASQVAILRSLTEASKLLESSAVPAVLRTGQLTLERIVQAATRVLADTCHHGYKYLAYYTLRSLGAALVQADVATLEERATIAKLRGILEKAMSEALQDQEEDNVEASFPKLTLALYDEHFDQLQELVDATLNNYVMCTDICELVPFSDSHSVVLGYLLLAVTMHHQCELATGDLVLHYVNVFNTHPYVEGILTATMRLLPAGVVHYMTATLSSMPRRFKPWFIRMQDFDLNEACTSSAVSRLACGVVLRALGGPGSAEARGWRGVRESREAIAVERLCVAAVAPALLNHQLAELMYRCKRFGDKVKVSVCLSTRSVACALRVEERGLRVRIKLSKAHPLVAPRVISPLPGPDPYWLSLYLGYRNGRLVEAIRMWLEAVGAALYDTVPCHVCYCHMHPLDGTPTSVRCYQCRNKFHTQCIRRWFSTSSCSNCPVCRTNF